MRSLDDLPWGRLRWVVPPITAIATATAGLRLVWHLAYADGPARRAPVRGASGLMNVGVVVTLIVAAVAAKVVFSLLSHCVYLWFTRSLQRALASRDRRAADRAVRCLALVRSRSEVDELYLSRLRLFICREFEDWETARRTLADLDLEHSRNHPGRGAILLAWVLAEMGDGPAALLLAEAFADRFHEHPEHRASAIGVLGLALHRVGRHSEAVARLREALATMTSPHVTDGELEFWLGESLLASGDREDAREAFARAASQSASSAWSRRAWERLAAWPAPHR